MSLVERQQQAAQQAATQTTPVTPGAPPPSQPPVAPVQSPEAKPYKHLIVIAAVLIVVALVTGCAILLSRAQSDTDPTVPPPATAVPSAKPTLSAKQQAAAEAIDRYTAYVKASNDSAQNGSDAAGVKRLVKEFTVNPQSTFDAQSGESGRAGKYTSTGYSQVTARVDSISSLSGKVPVAMLTTCTDNTGYTILKAGKPIPRTFQFIKSTVTMKRVNDRWMVADTVSPNEPNRESCTV